MKKKSPVKQRQRRERSPSRFRRTEASRLVRAALDAGLTIGRVEVDTVSGKISVIPGNAEAAANEWDKDKTLWPASA
jgi:hypothetical protein